MILRRLLGAAPNDSDDVLCYGIALCSEGGQGCCRPTESLNSRGTSCSLLISSVLSKVVEWRAPAARRLFL